MSQPSRSERLTADQAYQLTAESMRSRFVAMERLNGASRNLVGAEQIALHVRKVVEGVSFACLSAVEARTARDFIGQRSKDGDKLIVWLKAKGLLRLPAAQRVVPSNSSEFKAEFHGHAASDLSAEELADMYSRASSLLHERHPERLTDQVVEAECAKLEEDASASERGFGYTLCS